MTAEVEILVDTLVLPVASIEEDPNQPRRSFDVEALQALADNVEDTAEGSARPWIDGLLHPVVVYRSPGWEEGGPGKPYRLLVGGRRLKAYQLRGWTEIPARVVEAPSSVARTLMTQLNENLGRESTSLWEDALAVDRALQAWRDEHPGGLVKQFAAEFGRSPSWVSQHLGVARATGLSKVALTEGLIRHGEAFRLFAQLGIDAQRQLLYRARKNGTQITAALVREATSAASTAASETTQGEGQADAAPGTRTEPSIPARSITVQLAPDELRFLLSQLGNEPPAEDEALAGALLQTLSDYATLRPDRLEAVGA